MNRSISQQEAEAIANILSIPLTDVGKYYRYVNNIIKFPFNEFDKIIKKSKQQQPTTFPKKLVKSRIYPHSIWSNKMALGLMGFIYYLYSVGCDIPQFAIIACGYLAHYHIATYRWKKQSKKKINFKNTEQLSYFFGSLLTKQQIETLEKVIFLLKTNTDTKEFRHNIILAAQSYVKHITSIKKKHSKKKQSVEKTDRKESESVENDDFNFENDKSFENEKSFENDTFENDDDFTMSDDNDLTNYKNTNNNNESSYALAISKCLRMGINSQQLEELMEELIEKKEIHEQMSWDQVFTKLVSCLFPS